jgi:hypothetical protein
MREAVAQGVTAFPASPGPRTHMSPQRPVFSSEGRRIVICDYNALLLSVTGLLRMSDYCDYCVFQAHDGIAAEELCASLPEIALLVLNTFGTGIEVGGLVRRARLASPQLQVLHIGSSSPDGRANYTREVYLGVSPQYGECPH